MTFGAPRSLPLAISTQKTQVALSKNRPEGGIFILPLPVIDCLADEPHLGRACQDDSISSTSTPSLSPASSSTVATSDSESDPFEGPICPTAHTVATPHTEFGVCTNTAFRTRSAHLTGEPQPSHIKRDPPYFITATTYLSYLILVAFAHLRELVGKWFRPGRYRHLMPHDGYAPLNSDFDSFYTRRFKRRLDECFSQPATGVAGRTITLLDRISTDYNRTQHLTGTRTLALNLSSYNYLGFAQSRGACADAVEESIKRYGVGSLGARLEGGASDLLGTAEALVAKFVGKDDALISSMGFATNSTYIPALVDKGCLVISDELNHASIRFGVRISGADVRVFKHNDMMDLETLLREVISQGQPKTHRPWKKILVIVEGLYSMEGTLANIPALLELKRRYKFYLFVDEAHSIGALGPHGRGVADYFEVDPHSIDILMGTFTKSFGAAGGYIAGNSTLIDRLRVHAHSSPYAEAMAPPVITQIIASMVSIMDVQGVPDDSPSKALYNGSNYYAGPMSAKVLPRWLRACHTLTSVLEGKERLRRLAFNARYLHNALNKMGFITYGHAASPVIPLMIFSPGKMNLFYHMMRARPLPIAVVIVGYPATSLLTGRVRFCVSAAHTKEDIDAVIRACDEIGDILDMKYGLQHSARWDGEKCIACAEALGCT